MVTFFSARTPYEFWLCVLFAVWGLIIICLILWASKTDRAGRTDVIRSVVAIVVIVSAMLLATGGYAQDQIAAAYGLLGSIIGYIFGRATSAGATSAASGPPAGHTTASGVSQNPN